ncbi:MAG: mannan-binding lectin [Syntrophales bacterium]|nr:mannan-binding lectin [Syntrophales bacterium]
MKKVLVLLISMTFFAGFLLCGSAQAFNIRSGPISNDQDARTKCPDTCKWYGGWNGKWSVKTEGQMAWCDCNNPPQGNGQNDKNAGPIWNQIDANKKCPGVCKWYGGWNGNWLTTTPGQMSVCGCNEQD